MNSADAPVFRLPALSRQAFHFTGIALAVFHVYQKQSLGRSHDAGLFTIQGGEDSLHILLGFLVQAYFYQGSGEDSDHVIKEAVAGEGDGNIRAGLRDLDGFNGADCGLLPRLMELKAL